VPTLSHPARIKPAALKPGDKVGIVAPASSFNREEFEAGCAKLRQVGYEPVYSESIFDRDLYFAGTAARRVRELESMFERDDVKAIVCARGGYGANYLLPVLDLKKIAAHPKILVGYSDITCLLTHILDATGLVTFHGPMVAKDFAREQGVDSASWQTLTGATPEFDSASHSGFKALANGSAEGVLYGGCLSILVASLGTSYEIQTAGTVLFIEDVATKPYQADRMLMQLKLAGKFNGVRGVVFGEMLDCAQPSKHGPGSEEVVLRVVGDVGIPVAYGLPSGHVSNANITLPLGVTAGLEVDGTRVVLKMLEPATI
jgi:muramoyltetrapeptide carboxypeptidase